MCGIVGIVGERRLQASNGLLSARELMSHRGPDDAGLLCSERAAFGFRRLSIIDLSPAGHQPMTTADGGLWLVFNGEIYNYKELRRLLEGRYPFRSHTDSEVLLHGLREWGWAGLLERVDGMFAFALWDQSARRLYVARDRVGKKPLFYVHAQRSLLFASTLNSLLALLPGTPDTDPRALDAFLTYQAVPAPFTIFRGIHQLPPAHALVYDEATDRLEVARYWDLPYAPKLVAAEDEALEALDHLTRQAVRRRLESDVPLGAFLSGGVDSSLVVSLLAQESSRTPEAVVAGFEDPVFDERPYARVVAERWGVRLHEEVISPDIIEQLPEMIWHFGQPLADVSVVPTFAVSRAARRSVTVVLNGDGGDEGFAGYARPMVARAAAHYRRWLPRAIRSRLAHALRGREQGRLRRACLLADAGRASSREAFVYTRGLRAWRSLAYTERLSTAIGAWHPDQLYRAVWERAVASNDVDRTLYGDLTTYLPDQLLAKMDVATMAYGLEARSPLLDRQLLEYAARLPTELLTRRYTTKYLLKRLASRYVPREVLFRRKRGFVIPASNWLRGPLSALAGTILNSSSFRDRGWIRPDFVRMMLAEHMAYRRDWGEQLWTLLILEIWSRLFLDRSLQRTDPLHAVVP